MYQHLKSVPALCLAEIQGGAMNHGKSFFSKYRPSSLIEAVGSPEKDLLLCGDVLVIHLFDIL
jgi:hypothetical protein